MLAVALSLLATQPLDATFRLTLEPSLGFSPGGYAALGASLDFGWMPLRYVRLHTSAGAAALPTGNPIGDFDASLRVSFGADGVLPFDAFELFLGLESGLTYSESRRRPCFSCLPFAPEGWSWLPTLRFRGGVDFTAKRPLVLGVAIGYGLFGGTFVRELHWAEAYGRIGFAF